MALFKQNRIEELRGKIKANFGDLKDFLILNKIEVWFDSKNGVQGKTEGYTRCLKCGCKTLIIHPSQEIAHCVSESCGITADHISYFQRFENLKFRDAVRELCKIVGMEYKKMFQ